MISTALALYAGPGRPRRSLGAELLGYGAAISGVVIAVRIAWVFGTTAVIRARGRSTRRRDGVPGPRPDPLHHVLRDHGDARPPGAHHAGLIRRLGVGDDGASDEEELRARLTATTAALARIDELAAEDWTRPDTVDRMRAAYAWRKRRFAARAGRIEDDGYEEQSAAYQRTLREVLDAQRRAVVEIRNRGEISNDVMHQIERELDLEDSRLEVPRDSGSGAGYPGS